MEKLKNKIVSIGALLGFFSVVLGAFGTHALKGKIGYDLFEIYEVGTHYLAIHALAIVLYGLWYGTLAQKKVKCWPVILYLVGIFIFTGSLYIITFSGIRKWGAVTPIGGVCLLAAWLGFAWQSFKLTSNLENLR